MRYPAYKNRGVGAKKMRANKKGAKKLRAIVWRLFLRRFQNRAIPISKFPPFGQHAIIPA